MRTVRVFLSGVGLSALLLFVTTTSSAHLPGEGDAGPAPEHPAHPPKNQTQPSLSAFQESSTKYSKKTGISSNPPESRVTITVGEDNGFHYTVNGATYSPERIAVAGEYFNDELHGDGYVRLFLVAEPSIIYYAVRPLGDRLDVYVQNYYYDEFYYEIYTPYPVSGYDLRHGQINSTAILVTGPSRSAVHGRKAPSADSPGSQY